MVKDSVQPFLVIAIVFFTVMLIMLTGCAPDSKRKSEAPKNLAPTLDSVIAKDWVEVTPEVLDSLIENDTILWYPSPCNLDTIISDEYRMWIGENGDTIWE